MSDPLPELLGSFRVFIKAAEEGAIIRNRTPGSRPKKPPELGKGLGESIRGFRAAMGREAN